MSLWRIAQVNVAKLIAPLDDLRIDDFPNAPDAAPAAVAIPVRATP